MSTESKVTVRGLITPRGSPLNRAQDGDGCLVCRDIGAPWPGCTNCGRATTAPEGSADPLRRLAAERGADTHRASVRELAAVLVKHIRDHDREPSPDDRWAIGRFLDALADVSTPAASFELRALAREIGGR